MMKWVGKYCNVIGLEGLIIIMIIIIIIIGSHKSPEIELKG